jgi:hypothetical protein
MDLIAQAAKAVRLMNCISLVNTCMPNSRERFTWAIARRVINGAECGE